MKYLLLCHMQPAAMANRPDDAEARMGEALGLYNRQLIQAGVLVAAGQLAPPHTTQRVEAGADGVHTTAGPALPGDTQIGGYYVIDVSDAAEATQWAGRCPIARFGALEVRQVAYAPL